MATEQFFGAGRIPGLEGSEMERSLTRAALSFARRRNVVRNNLWTNVPNKDGASVFLMAGLLTIVLACLRQAFLVYRAGAVIRG